MSKGTTAAARALGLVAALGCGGGSAAPPPGDAGADHAVADAGAPWSLADALQIDQIAFQQTVKVTTMSGGWPTKTLNAPLIDRRKGIARVYLTAVRNRRFKARRLEAELHVVAADGERVLRDARTIAGASSETDLETTFDLAYDESFLAGAKEYWVDVRDAAAAARGERGAALRWPPNGTNPLAVEPNPGPLKIRFVPVAYGADGSNRVPDTSAARLAELATQLHDRFPVSRVDVDARAPIAWPNALQPDGDGWSWLLNAVMEARATDAPASDVYYVGLVDPRPSFDAYCGNGCLAGLAPTAGLAIPSERAVLALGFGGAFVDETIPHELGHVMGRAHAPCGNPGGPDPDYPYPNASIGVTGWREADRNFFFEAADVMSYCIPGWISDYTYAAIAARVRTVNAQGSWVGARAPVAHRRVLVDARGGLSWGRTLKLDGVVGGDEVAVELRDAGGAKVGSVSGRRFGYDHVPGGFVLFEEPATAWASASIASVGSIAR